MKPLLLSLFVLIMQNMCAQDWAQLGRYQAANANLTSDPIELLFMGDSITEGWPQFRPEIFQNNPFVGRGIGGQTTPQMLLRFRQDVIALQPKKVILLAGINDIAENTGPTRLDQIMDNIKSMAEIAKANSVEMILCSVLPANSFPWRPEIVPTQKVIDLNKKIQAYAKKQGLVYVDYYTPMVDRQGGLKANLGYDTVHPNKIGYQLMEKVLSKHFTFAHE